MRKHVIHFQKQLLFVLTLLAFSFSCIAQEASDFTMPDSLKTKTYKELTAAFAKDQSDSINRHLYARAYIVKATQDNNRLELAKGYELLAFVHYKDYPQSFIYYDKAIELSKDLGHKRYPAILYTYKGAVLSTDGKYKEALENHLKAMEYSEANGNIELLFVNKHNIGILKRHLELYDEALQIFKECYKYELHNPKRDEFDFLYSHLSLSEIYTETKALDSALKYNSLGDKLAKKLGDNETQKLFLLNKGTIFFHQKKYRVAIEHMKNAIDSLHNLRDKFILTNGYLYIAKAYDSLQQTEKAISYYKKVDSVFTEHPHHVSSIIMNAYTALHNHYGELNDKENEALYIKKSLQAYDNDKKNYRTLSNEIIKTFDRRKLLEKQKELNEALTQKDKKYTLFIIIAFIVCAIFIYTLVTFYIKQKNIKKRFHEFVQHQKEKAAEKPEKVIEVANKEAKQIGLAEDVIDQLLKSLHKFENEHIYIQPDITLPSLSKRLKTNSTYLSKVINTYKNKKFADYLNDLRIDYAVQKIQTDKHFRLYTIKAIAMEVGFSTSQSFARAFKRKTGIKPSDFIKQLESSEE